MRSGPAPSIPVDDIEAAVLSGMISRDQADALLEFSTKRSSVTGHADEENLRFISSFNDIFVTIGVVLFIGALTYLTYDLKAASGLLVAGAAWALAEYFTRSRRLALPSIALLVVFAGSVFWGAASLFGDWPVSFAAGQNESHIILAGLITMGAVGLHWRRFRVPITVAAGVSTLLMTIMVTFSTAVPSFFEAWATVILFCLGLLVFALAMAYDRSDRARVTRRTDIAFWLHLLAAPLIVHPVVWPLASAGVMTTGSALAVLAIFVLLGFVALVVDRRALLVSSLSYLVYAAAQLLTAMQWQSSASAVAVMLVGAAVLMLSIAWRPLRTLFVRILPSRIAASVPAAS